MALVSFTSEIISALTSNRTLTDWVGKLHGIPNISFGTSPSATFPSIIVYTVYNRDGEFADDDPMSSVIRYQVTLFSDKPLSTRIASEVDKEMRKLGFTRNNFFDLYHDSTRTYQGVMLFDQELEII